VSDVVKFEYTKSNKSQLVQKNINQLLSIDILTLNDWNQLSSEMKSKFPGFLVTVLDDACQQAFGQRMTYKLEDSVVAFQNNNSSIKKVGEVFLHNLSIVNGNREKRYLYLVIASSLWGVGKTRFAFEFLDQWRKLVSSDAQYKERLEANFSEELKILDRAQLVYVTLFGSHKPSLSMEQNFNHALMDSICAVFNIKKPSNQVIEDVSFSVSNWIRKTLPNTPIFLAIDELGHFAKGFPVTRVDVNPLLYSAYCIWETLIYPLQCTPNVCVYVAGKGAYLDIIGKGKVRFALGSPMEVLSVLHHLFIKSDVEGIIEQTTEMSTLHEHMKENPDLKEYVIKKILDETSGVPLLVKKILLDGRELLSKCMNEPDVDQCVAKLLMVVTAQFKDCYSTLSPSLLPIYEKMIALSLLDISIDIEESISAERLGVQNSIEFAGFPKVDIRDLVAMLNCYAQPVEENRVKLVVPRIIRESFKQNPFYHSDVVPAFESLVRQYGHILDKGDFFEYLVSVMIRLRINDGANENRILGQALPFLKETPLDQILCVQISETLHHTGQKLARKNVKGAWPKILDTTPMNTIAIFEDNSHPDKFIKFENNKLLCIQDKNAVLSFEELREEIDKTSKISDSANSYVLVLMAREVAAALRHQYIWRPKQQIIATASNATKTGDNTILVPDRMTVVLVTGNTLEEFLGIPNTDIIFNLKNVRKDNGKNTLQAFLVKPANVLPRLYTQ
jgi:hypothetical protein